VLNARDGITNARGGGKNTRVLDDPSEIRQGVGRATVYTKTSRPARSSNNGTSPSKSAIAAGNLSFVSNKKAPLKVV